MQYFVQIASNALLLSASITAVYVLFHVIKYYLDSRRPKHFPPGPPAAPFVGNLLQLRRSKAFLQFHDWRKTYGNIIGLKFGPQNVVILNSHKQVKELFDYRGGIYSSRPYNFVGNELVCPDNTHILVAPYGARWRQLRKCVQVLTNVTVVDRVLPIQSAEATEMLYQLIENPNNWYTHIRRYATGVILAAIFGQRGKNLSEARFKTLYHNIDEFTELLEPGNTPPVELLPFLAYIPGFLAPWKKQAVDLGDTQRELYAKLLDETKAKVAQGIATGCWMERLLAGQEKNGLTDSQIAYLGGIIMEAGSDTTMSTLSSFYLAMLRYPEVLRKCQDEVDSVCVDRTPNAGDMDNLPYLRATMTEVLRWRPVAASGFPHVSTQDDYYNGYYIPKGTMVFPNTWAISHDEAEFDSPDECIPERWLENKFGAKSEASDADDQNRRITYAFGAGRRVCPGQRLAENALIVNMAKIVWTFDLSSPSPTIDTSPETAYSDGFLIHPLRFPITFTPRSSERVMVVKKEYIESDVYLSGFV